MTGMQVVDGIGRPYPMKPGHVIRVAKMRQGEMLMNYKSLILLDQEERLLRAWFDREWSAVKSVADLTKAMLARDSGLLSKGLLDHLVAKASPVHLSTAKADVAELRKQSDGMSLDGLAVLAQGHRMAAVMREFTKRTAALDDEKRRARRYNNAWTSGQAFGQPTVH